MKKKALILGLTTIFMVSMASSALQGYVIESGPSEFNSMIYNWGQASSNKYYQDGIAYSADLGLMVCDDSGGTPSNKYVGASYYMDGQNTGISQLTSYGDSTLALADQSTSFQGMNCKRTGFAPMTISPSVISGTPTTKIAAFPADIYIQASDNQDGSNSQFLDVNSEYAGGYSGQSTYTYSTNQISTSLNNIRVNSDIGTRSFSPGTSGRGINNDRPLLFGVCNDQTGQNCQTGADKLTSPTTPTYTFDIAKQNVNDQNVYTRYAVANGKRFDKLDIGANLRTSSLSVEKDPIYFSQTQNIDFTIANNGNVPVTSSFTVTAEITDSDGNVVDSEQFSISQDLAQNGGTVSRSYQWEAREKSGTYTVQVTADSQDDIEETSEGDNSDSTNFELKPITLPEIFVNGQKVEKEEIEFPSPGVPYNFSVKMKNSDNITLSNSTVELVEKDGISSFSPTQEIDNDTITNVQNKVTYNVDENGRASITLIPTGNVLLADKYDQLDIQGELDYTLRLKGVQEDGTEFKFINNGTLQNYYPLETQDPGTYDGSTVEDLPNLDNYAKLAMDRVYTIFTGFWRAVT